MNWILTLWLTLQSTPAEAKALQGTAPMYLTQATATQHLGATRLVGAKYDIDPAVLLSVAYHESRFVVDLSTRESGGRVSCGVMTPAPQEHCGHEDLTLLGGYLAGASHLRAWIDVCHTVDHWHHDVNDEVILRCALWAYAGGRGFRTFCETRPGYPGCDTVTKFEERARRIRRALDHAPASSTGVPLAEARQ